MLQCWSVHGSCVAFARVQAWVRPSHCSAFLLRHAPWTPMACSGNIIPPSAVLLDRCSSYVWAGFYATTQGLRSANLSTCKHCTVPLRSICSFPERHTYFGRHLHCRECTEDAAGSTRHHFTCKTEGCEHRKVITIDKASEYCFVEENGPHNHPLASLEQASRLPHTAGAHEVRCFP